MASLPQPAQDRQVAGNLIPYNENSRKGSWWHSSCFPFRSYLYEQSLALADHVAGFALEHTP